MDEKKAPDLKKAPEAGKVSQIKKSANTVNTGIKQTQAKAQKKKKKISAGTLICIVLIVLIAGAVAAVYFDIGGAKQIAASLLKLDAPVSAEGGTENSAAVEQLDQREKTLDEKEQELSKKEDELNTKEQELGTKEQDITQRESAVKETEKTIDEQQKEYYTSVAQIYEKMDVKKAAKAISGLASTQEMAQVLLYMTKDQAGKVMDQINATVATQILSEMMK